MTGPRIGCGSDPYAGFPPEHSRSPDSDYLYGRLGSPDCNDPSSPGSRALQRSMIPLAVS